MGNSRGGPRGKERRAATRARKHEKWLATMVVLRLSDDVTKEFLDHIGRNAPTMGQLSVWLQRHPRYHDIVYPKKEKA